MVLNLIGKTSIFFESSQVYCVAPDESTDRKATMRKLHENPSGKTMILLCFCPYDYLPRHSSEVISESILTASS